MSSDQKQMIISKRMYGKIAAAAHIAQCLLSPIAVIYAVAYTDADFHTAQWAVVATVASLLFAYSVKAIRREPYRVEFDGSNATIRMLYTTWHINASEIRKIVVMYEYGGWHAIKVYLMHSRTVSVHEKDYNATPGMLYKYFMQMMGHLNNHPIDRHESA